MFCELYHLPSIGFHFHLLLFISFNSDLHLLVLAHDDLDLLVLLVKLLYVIVPGCNLSRA
jgi:hypothetical protein